MYYSILSNFATRCFRSIVPILGGTKGGFYQHYVCMPHTNSCPSSSHLSGDKFHPFSDMCVGAIDGTHIPVCSSTADRA